MATISIPSLLAKAQKVFNRYIRERDKDLGCISCTTGQPEQAGHYYAAGSISALRFNEINCNGQCVRCNYYKGSNAIEYRKGLIHKYGEQKVLLLDRAKDLGRFKKWSRIELEWIIGEYARKCKELTN